MYTFDSEEEEIDYWAHESYDMDCSDDEEEDDPTEVDGVDYLNNWG